eukprot:30801-Pelagococcus_subviridis.AAC.2
MRRTAALINCYLTTPSNTRSFHVPSLPPELFLYQRRVRVRHRVVPRPRLLHLSNREPAAGDFFTRAHELLDAHAFPGPDVIQRGRILQPAHDRDVRVDEVGDVDVIPDARPVVRGVLRPGHDELVSVAQRGVETRGADASVMHQRRRRVLAQAPSRVRAEDVEVSQNRRVEPRVRLRVVSHRVFGVQLASPVRVYRRRGRLLRNGHDVRVPVRRARGGVN